MSNKLINKLVSVIPVVASVSLVFGFDCKAVSTYKNISDYKEFKRTASNSFLNSNSDFINKDIIFKKNLNKNTDNIEFYSQHDSRWSLVSYSSDNISSSGCPLASTAMALNGLNHSGSKVIDINGDGKITPDELANYSTSKGTVTNACGTTFAFYPNVSKELGVNLKEIIYNPSSSQDILKELKDSLKSGKTIVAFYGQGHWISHGGHSIALVGLSDNDEIIVHDPNLNNYEDTRHGRYNGPNPDSNIVGSNANPLRFFVFG